jgi:acyl transferase domain-containing protein
VAAPRFGPIAIVGQACLLPEASTPAELWSAVAAGRDLLSQVPEGRWRIAPHLVRAAASEGARDRTWSDRGGYVRRFESLFEPEGFRLPPEEILGLDRLFQWVLHTAREALRAAGYDAPTAATPRAGLVLGNLSFPTASLARLAEATWLGPGQRVRELSGPERPDPRNRFMSGLPAQLAARALGLSEGGFALDAACASSLYALKLACDRLHDRQADLMLAGAVNCADDLFIHVGFCALQALSRSGRSRPFHREADGLACRGAPSSP